MKRILWLLAISVAAFSGLANAGISVSIGEPGFFGAIDIGNAPPPEVYSQQPVIVAAPSGPPIPPVYLRVPPEHRAHWKRYCAQYNACGRPVYFVQDRWYTNVYAPHYKQHHDFYKGRRDFEDRRDHDRGHDHDHDHDHDHH
ncbi:MAG TPA: hypothetical protein VIE69_09290 [Methylophilaceae bacterium]